MVYAEFTLKTRNRANKARINPADREQTANKDRTGVHSLSVEKFDAKAKSCKNKL